MCAILFFGSLFVPLFAFSCLPMVSYLTVYLVFHFTLSVVYISISLCKVFACSMDYSGLPKWFSSLKKKKNPSAMQVIRVRSLGQEDPLEEKMATHSIFLLGKSHGQRSMVGHSL